MKSTTFSAGPSQLPKEVVERIQRELPAYEDSGVSILSLGHRSSHFVDIVNTSVKYIRELCRIPPDYEVLLLPGGGAGQFDAVPLNLMHLKGGELTADYLVSGFWSKQAAQAAKKYGRIRLVPETDSALDHFPKAEEYSINSDSAYFYYCSNETIDGIEAPGDLDIESDVRVVADMSSNFATRPFDIRKYGLVFSCSQKNLGVAGVTVVIVKNDLLECAHRFCPSVLNYKTQSTCNSIFNTPPIFSIYVMHHMLEWMRSAGGLEEMDKIAVAKSSALYAVIDASNGFYRNKVAAESRSRCNVVFQLKDSTLDSVFLKEAKQSGLLNLSGHRVVGGMRASVYAGVTLAEVQNLAGFMEAFQEKYEK